MANITVITSITGGKDGLQEKQNKGTARFVAYTDAEKSDTWELRKPYDKFTSARRNSRVYKMLPHQFVDTEYSIWIDGNIRLLKTPDELVETYLKDHDIAMFPHPGRSCLYDEAMVCAKAHLDDPEVIIEQVKKYEDDGFAKQKGLFECSLIIRRHTPEIETLNNAWWSEYCRHSVRDQISFPYVLDKTAVHVQPIVPNYWIQGNDGEMNRGNIATYIAHLTARPEPHG